VETLLTLSTAAVLSIKNLAGTIMASMKLREKIQKFEDLHELVLPFHALHMEIMQVFERNILTFN